MKKKKQNKTGNKQTQLPNELNYADNSNAHE